MIDTYFQACYAHPDTGWAVVNTSENMPQSLIDEFSLIERGNAGLAANKTVPMGMNENPTCMFEVYYSNGSIGLVRVQYRISDSQGRPISFAQGYIFQNAYHVLKTPENLLRVSGENYSMQKIPEQKKKEIRSTPGALNRELISLAEPDSKQELLLTEEEYSVKNAMEVCGISEEAYLSYMLAVYSHLLLSNMERNLYVKTDGTERYAKNLLFLTYQALPYSLRTQITASTFLHEGQHNTKLIFCYEVPGGVPFIEPVNGSNNVVTETVAKRTRDRNPIIEESVHRAVLEEHEQWYKKIALILEHAGDEQLNTMQILNLVSHICAKDYEKADDLPGIVYGWMALSVQNTEKWELIAGDLLFKALTKDVHLGKEVDDLVRSRRETAVTAEFRKRANAYLASVAEK